MDKTAYLLLRLGIGISMFGHGLVRLPKLQTFSDGMVSSFEKSILPKFLVLPYSYVLPIAEFAVGLLVILGLFTKQALTVGGFLMLSLMIGTTLIEKWDGLSSQFIHLGVFVVCLQFIAANSWALDNVLKKQ